MMRGTARRALPPDVTPGSARPSSARSVSPFTRCSESAVPYRAERPAPAETSLRRADALALSLRSAQDRIVIPLARACGAFVDRKGWIELGRARASDHCRERFGRSSRWLRDLAALAGAIDRLPALGEALVATEQGGPIGRVAARIIAGVADSGTVRDWIDLACRVPVRALREAARAARREGSTRVPPLPGIAESAPPLTHLETNHRDGRPSPDETRAESTPATRSRDNPWAEAPGHPVRSGSPAAGEGPSRWARHERVDRGPLPGDPDEGEDQESRDLVRFLVPAPVAAAFDETLDLYRAVAGAETTVAEFVDMLVADADAGLDQLDDGSAHAGHEIGRSTLRRGDARAATEMALSRTTGNWSHLPRAVDPDWAFALAGMSLAAFDALAAQAGRGSVVEVEAQIRALIRIEDDLERRLAGVLADMADRRAWVRLRFDGVGHYAEQRLGMSRTAAQDRVRAHRCARALPAIRAAYERSEIGLETTLRLARLFESARVTQSASQRAWVDHARTATVKRMRDETRALIRLRGLGDGATGPGGTPPDDAAWHRSLRREPGTSRRRMAAFGRAAIDRPLSDTFLRLRLPCRIAERFVRAVESARCRVTALVEGVPWDQPWPDPAAPASVFAARTFSIRCRRTPDWVGLLALLEGFVATWDDPEAAPKRASDAVYVRDGWRCMAPGCTSRRNLEDHHVTYRSAGGSDAQSNRVCVCRFHHRMGEHGDLARCRGTAPLGITWTLGRGGVGGRFRNEIRLG